MRLLHRRDGKFTLTEDLPQNEIPRYAILSHTWGKSSDEISFQDIQNKSDAIVEKPGYRKLTFCADQAAKDGLEFFWIDTCCIHKDNLRELDEAIRCMFRWYQYAAKCYVYLSDVSVANPDNQEFWENSFCQSRWFYRGWTLQELLAPAEVDFFCAEGFRLGSKKTLVNLLAENTGIAVAALQGKSLAEFDPGERFSWTKHRHTQREEDKVYCLFGIFGVSMSVMYGEGKSNAMRRLQDEIQRVARPRRIPDSPPPQYVASRPVDETAVLEFGNEHELVAPRPSHIDPRKANQHKWKFFVRCNKTDIIERVEILLHKSFKDPLIICDRPPYEVQRIGWGYFVIGAHVVLKQGYIWVVPDFEDELVKVGLDQLLLTWKLNFEGTGSSVRRTLNFRHRTGTRESFSGQGQPY